MVIHGDKLRWLFWLRWKMLTRRFTRNPASIIGAIVLLVVVLGMAGSVAFGTFAAYRFMDAPANTEVLYLVLTGLCLLWIVLPLLEFTGNEGLDVSKLTLFPLTRSEIATSLIFSTLLDIPTLGLFLLLAAVVAGWSYSLPLGLMAFVVMVVFYVQVIGLSQLILALLMRTLQSRRFRDLSIILIAVFTSSCYLLQRIALGGAQMLNLYDNLKHAAYSPFLQWLPPGYAARSIQEAYLGNWGMSFALLGLLLVTSVVALYLWQVVLERSLSTPEVGGSARAKRQRKERVVSPVAPTIAQPAGASLLDRFLSPQVTAIARKDLLYFWRDPQLKAMLFQSIIYVAVFIVAPLFNQQSGSSFTSNYIMVIAPLVVLLFMTTLSLNVLGLERQGLTALFLFPVDPKRILWGKNLAVFTMGAVELAVLILVCGFLSHLWNLALPAAVLGLAGMGVTLGCGNITSVFFPQYVRQMQRGFRATGNAQQGGCLRAVMSLVMLVVTAVVMVPVLLAIGLPLIFHAQWIWVVTLPLSLLYGIVFHQAATRMVAPRILDKAPEILAVTTRE